MLKMFSTQLSGLFKKIQEVNEFSFEDGARLLAQAVVGDGHVYIYGNGEMAAMAAEATEGAEPLKFIRNWRGIEEVTSADRVVLFTRYSNDDAALTVGQELSERGIPFVVVCTVLDDDSIGSITSSADAVIDLKLERGLIPDETGNRVGYPGAMAGLFAYYGLRFTLEEILADYE
ncbi:DUF2529 family protein [Bacillus marasmi]|uniref:DUF2529 family protein n=1 Tax=Bacillus marasmi TaxID=1926279 RepID=UPI0011CAB106|nr:DUF2529 family protein [Bacillus marasmi]